MDVHYVVEILIVLLTYSAVAVMPTNSTPVNIQDWLRQKGDDPTRRPIVKYVQLFNNGANAYVRITNKTVDATTTNDTDPGTYLQLDMFGPTLRAIRSYRTGQYICHNPTTGYVEMKVISTIHKHPACLFIKASNQSYKVYKSKLNKNWFLAFHFKGRKAGRPRKAQRTTINNKGSMYVQDDLNLSLTKR